MYINEHFDDFDMEDYNVNVRMVTFIVIIMVAILTLVYFVRIYATKKEHVIKDMEGEFAIIETVISDHLNYSRYFVNAISNSIKGHYEDLNYIQEELRAHFESTDFNKLFGWKKYGWVDKNFKEVISSDSGIKYEPIKKPLIKKIAKEVNIKNPSVFDSIIFYTSHPNTMEHGLKIIDIVKDKKTKKFIGALTIRYDLDQMIRSLNSRKNNPIANFLILDKDYNFVAASKPEIDHIIDSEGEFSKHISVVLEKFRNSDEQEVSYLDMVNGLNYHIKHLKDLPFIIIVNIDNEVIKRNILDSVSKKFIEVSVFAVLCLFMIVSIYKRETILRARAERATKKANEATKAKTNFLAFTAHEIRSPLGFILTGSELMIKHLLGPLPESYHKYAEGIHQNSKIILDFITDILDENQIIEGKFKIVNSLASIEEITYEAIKQNIGRYGKREIDITTDFEEHLPLLVCDRMRMLQVISNLINNSIKYSNEKVVIIVSLKVVDDKMIFTLTDKGIGMTYEDIKTAMNHYGASGSSKNHNIGSYGLGLSIVKMLLEAHDADLSITSAIGEGTTVRIFFPKHKLVYNHKRSKVTPNY